MGMGRVLPGMSIVYLYILYGWRAIVSTANAMGSGSPSYSSFTHPPHTPHNYLPNLPLSVGMDLDS